MTKKNRRFKGIGLLHKISLILVLSLLFAVSLQTYATLSYGWDILLDQRVDEGHWTIGRLVSEVDYGSELLEKRILSEVSSHEGVVFYKIADPQGRVYLSNEPEAVGSFLDGSFLDVNESIVLASFYSGEEVRIFVSRADNSDLVVLCLSLDGVQDIMSGVLLGSILLAVVILSVSIVFTYLLTNSVIVPINRLMAGVEEVGRGNLDYKINIKTKDEVGRLALAFNKMAFELKRSRKELEDYSKGLEDRVYARTEELNCKVIELKEARAAAINLFEDVDLAKKELEGSYERLREADKLKDEFMNIAAHELKTPLVPIIGYTSMLRDESLGSLNAEQKQSFGIISRNIERLKKLINDILDISKLESQAMKFDMRDVKVADLVDNAVQDMESYAKDKGIYLKAVLKQDLPIVVGDRNRLMQVLTDLIVNAIKFTDEGGITLEAELVGDHVHIGIIDTGIGIKQENISKLFTKFFQIDSSISRRYGGTGLGLAICRKIIEAHGGKIWVTSKHGKGSVFQFNLPVKHKNG